MFSRFKTLKLSKLKETDTRESFQILSQTRIHCIHWYRDLQYRDLVFISLVSNYVIIYFKRKNVLDLWNFEIRRRLLCVFVLVCFTSSLKTIVRGKNTTQLLCLMIIWLFIISYSVWDVFNNFLLIDATDRSKISSDQKRFLSD